MRNKEKPVKRGKAKSSDAKIVRIRTEINRMALFKTAMAALLLLLQLGIILSFNFLFLFDVKWYFVTLAIISIITAVCVISSHRNVQAKAAWVLFILIFFPFGFIIYIMSNDRVMYARPRKRHKAIYQKSEKFVKPYGDPNAADDFVKNCRFLNHSGGFVPYGNTGLEYFPSAAGMFDDVLEKLKTAEKFVFIEFFAIAEGVLLGRIARILKQKLAQGVQVFIIYDDMGTRSLSRSFKKEMKKCGAKIKAFNRLVSRFTFALNYRDHRKIIVIDGKVAYTGGCNLADEYVNEKRMHGYWKDCGLRVTGEAVDALTLIFLRQWEYIVKTSVDYAEYIGLSEEVQSPFTCVPFACGPEFEQSVYKAAAENVVSSARQRLYIMTPYFVPDENFMHAITVAAMAGVDVRLVLPEVPDKAYVYLITKDNAEKLLKYGVKVYYLRDAFVHAKVMLTENCALIGSANLDMRSFFQQFENAVLTDDEKILTQVGQDFEKIFPDCKQVTAPHKNGFFKGAAVKLLRIVSPLM